MLPGLMFEMFLCMLFIPPGVDSGFDGYILGGGYYQYSYDAILCIFTLGKSYLVLRLYSHFSKWTSEDALKIW
jgi:hypothetical protein